MVGDRRACGRGLVVVGLCLLLLGCPLMVPTDNELYLVVSPSELHFGTALDTAVIEIHKSNSPMTLPPIVVTSASPWIVVQDCKGIEDGCVSNGPLDEIDVRIRVDRSLMEAGANSGSVRIAANGVAAKQIPVTATALVVADFFAANRAAETVDVVEFENRSEAVPGWRITSYLWDFGDGTTSTRENPAPHRFLEPGNYDVALTVTATNNGQQMTVTTLRTGYIIVTDKLSPTADFTVSMTDTLVNTPVFFEDASTAGTAPITGYEWDFGDGTTSSQQNPVHTYEDIGTFTVSLTVFSTDGNDTETKTDLILIRPVPPVADFEASDVTPAVNDPVEFTDLSEPGSAPIMTWEWDFGDGETSDEQNPVHTFTTAGTFTVELRVTTAHATDTETKIDYITTHTVAPVADFTANETRILTGDTVRFTDRTARGSSPIVSWSWDFGDGGTSSSQNPTHTYTTAGPKTVRLTVITAHGTDTAVKSEFIGVFEPTALDRYIRNGDDTYAFTAQPPLLATGAKVHVLDLTSQTWREGFVDKPVWTHHLTVVEPAQILHDTAILFISGGSNTSGPPNLGSGDVQALVALATATKTVAAYIRQVPSEPLIFSDETRTRTEDEIIAYTFDKFMETGVEEWPALFPMVKSVVRAMDAVQDFDNQFTKQVNRFVLTGASKRGWTTWLTAAADARVVGIAPMVIDVLNMPTQMEHHFNVYGYYAEDIHDYVDMNVFDRLDTPEGMALNSIVDPFAYRERLTMPKYIINGTGDQFFVPDSAQFYFDQLLGQKHLRYIPNVDHGLGGYANVVASLVPWYQSVLSPTVTPPPVTWTVEAENRIKAQVPTTVQPIAVKLWVATSVDRDFRTDPDLNAHTPPVWTSLNLSPTAPGMYVGEVATPQDAWTGFFIELTLPSPFAAPYVFTTETRVTPDVYPVVIPFPPIVDFTVDGDNTMPVADTPVQFLDLTNTGPRPVIVRQWDFGDGTTSRDQDPIHTYSAPGTYDVSLTVQTAFGTVTETKEDFITVVVVPPTVDFTADPLVASVGNPVAFTDLTTVGSASINAWSWDFGDGQGAIEQRPTHVYEFEGEYDVTLTVITDHGSASLTRPNFIEVNGETALDAYLAKDDPSYSYTHAFSSTSSAFGVPVEVHYIDLTSQTWRTAEEVNRPVWQHRLSIVVPANLDTDTALLFINGGSNPGSFPDPIDSIMAQLSVATESVLALLSQVPNEPLTFVGDGASRTEDEIIAYTFRRYLDGGDDEWPLMLPMVKSAVRAMDTVQDFLAVSKAITIDDFIVTGASKRGWTTWLTGATDPRVIGIAPMVIDFLNVTEQFPYHYSAYNSYSPAIHDYEDEDVLSRMLAPEGISLNRIVDPYEYRDRLTMPKYVITATGDEFFVLDSAQFYYHDLLGLKHLYSVPGASHSMSGHEDTVLSGLATWSNAVINNTALPQVTWTIDGNGMIEAHSTVTPTEVRMYQATSPIRDFRNTYGPAPVWTSTPATPVGNNTYRALAPVPASGYVAYYLLFKYNVGPLAHYFSTEVEVLPTAMPYLPAK